MTSWRDRYATGFACGEARSKKSDKPPAQLVRESHYPGGTAEHAGYADAVLGHSNRHPIVEICEA